VSARPLVTQRGLWRRVWRVVPTFAASWPEGPAWRRRTDAAPGRSADAFTPDAAAWTAGDDDWTPEFGR
jgi:hypothetical protein